MYRGFKIDITTSENLINNFDNRSTGSRLFNKQSADVSRGLRKYILSGNYLDGSGLQKSWFPTVDADVFISHSHSDKKVALALAGWLYDEFSITSFIDSTVWGYGDTLLKELDEEYCNNIGENTYNYKERNRSTSHVHLMVASALTSMIDQCEAFFLLNTRNSIKLLDNDEITESPWLYFEIGQSQTIRKKVPDRTLYEAQRSFSEGGVLEKALKVSYKVDLNHLNMLGEQSLQRWERAYSLDQNEHPLDLLYELFPPKKYSNQING